MSKLLYMGAGVAFEEKRAWMGGVVTIVTYTVYVIVILSRSGETPLRQVPYVATMIWTVVGAIIVSIVLEMVIAATTPKDDRRKDQRDKEISYFADRIAQAFIVIGGVAALVLAMMQASHFWIANAVYLAFVLTTILNSVAKIAAYRWGFQR